MKNTAKTITTMALAFALAATPLLGCSGQTGQGEAEADTTEQAPEPVDVSGWKTLGDALAVQTDPLASSFNDKYYVSVFESNGAFVRVVAKMQKGMADKINEIDFFDEEYSKKLIDVAGGLELVSAEDITNDAIPQEELDALVGKTGKELMDDGFTFVGYNYYGAENEAGAAMEKGYFSYDITFAATVSEEETNDEGAAIMDAKVTSALRGGVSNAAVDPEAAK